MALGRLLAGSEGSGGEEKESGGEAARELAALLDPAAVPAKASEWQQFLSPDSWSGQCSEDVVVLPLWAAGDSLRAELRLAEAALDTQAPLVFAARVERATAAGEVEALEEVAAAPSQNLSARKETLRGVCNATKRADQILWQEAALQKQVVLVLARTQWEARRHLEEREEHHDAELMGGRLKVAKERLKLADRVLLEVTRKLEDLAETRDNLAERLRNHRKSILWQCLPPDPGAPRSRYTRFELTSSAATAVQLSLEVGDFFARSVSSTIPALRDVVAEAVQDLSSGAGRNFSAAPEMSRWWEWMPEPAQGGDIFLGFDGFTERYKAAMQAYDAGLSHGGPLAALHSLWTRWKATSGTGSTRDRGAHLGAAEDVHRSSRDKL
jgi:hypothetical protein